MDILGVPIDVLTREDILTHVRGFLEEPRFHRIATVNPEFLLLAEKDEAFRAALLAADLRIADGFGIVLAGLLHGECIHRFPGADLMEEIFRIAEKKNQSVYLVVRKDGLSSYEEVRSAILKKYPSVKISGADIDPKIDNSQLVINTPVIFCNFGTPEQEIFLDSLKNQNNIRLAMGVGGSFDYLTGRQKRAPKWIRTIGLEWLWRIILQPKRIKRIWNAVIVFPFRVIFATMNK